MMVIYRWFAEGMIAWMVMLIHIQVLPKSVMAGITIVMGILTKVALGIHVVLIQIVIQTTAKAPSRIQRGAALPLLLRMDTIVVLVMSGKTGTITAIPAGIPTTRSFQAMIATMLMAGTIPVAGSVTGTA